MSETSNRAAGKPGDRFFTFVQRVDGRYWSTAFFLGLFAYTLLLVITAMGYSGPAGLFPIAVGLPLLGLIVVKVVVTLFAERLGIESVDLFEDIQDLGEDEEEGDEVDERITYRREFETTMWVSFAVVSIWLLGHLPGLLVFVFGFVYAYERDLLRAGGATGVTFLFVYLLFRVILGANLYEGVLGVGGVI
jgi:hypothetical protein